MSTLDATRAELALVVLYLNKAEARDKICRAIQYGSKFLSNGEAVPLKMLINQLAWLGKFFAFLSMSMICMLSLVQLFKELLFQLFYWESQKMHCYQLSCFWIKLFGLVEQASTRISFFCWMGSSVCTSLVELAELGRLSRSMKKLEKDLKNTDKYQNEAYNDKLKISNERTLALVKAGMDIVVAVGLLQLAPKKVTPRVTGGFGFVSSLISCYQLLPSSSKSKTN
ncbi:hypothetical protein Scep_026701 [Stephania cephalantha]|uniref:Peroxisomal membrane protein 11C n=1 Tax=Stephania cephalantha TaxID=152367 RepID=A0AAP0HSA2_9MAGN